MKQSNMRACCYTLDENFLFPTLLSARQMRSAVADTDVIVFCIGCPSKKSEALRGVFEVSGIIFKYVDPATIDHLPIIFARFFLHRMLDPKYQAILYLDGDTQISGDLSPLLDIHLPPGKFLAARDPMSIVTEDNTRAESLAYLESIGISEQASKLYCNSGVLRFNLSDWEQVGREVIAASSEKNHQYRFPDQDPLNLMFGDKYLTMSYRWNFPSFFLGLGLREVINPNIVHFMSRPRPWDGPFQPWGRPHFDVYGDLVREFPEIAPYAHRAGFPKTVRYHFQQYAKRLLENPNWTHSSVRRQILETERQCIV